MKKLTRIGKAESTALALELDELDDLNTDIDDLDSDDSPVLQRRTCD